MNLKTLSENADSSNKYNAELVMLDKMIEEIEKKSDIKSSINLQEMKRRRENIYLAIRGIA